MSLPAQSNFNMYTENFRESLCVKQFDLQVEIFNLSAIIWAEIMWLWYLHMQCSFSHSAGDLNCSCGALSCSCSVVRCTVLHGSLAALQWHNDRPCWPRTAEGCRFRGAQNCLKMWDIFSENWTILLAKVRNLVRMYIFKRFLPSFCLQIYKVIPLQGKN